MKMLICPECNEIILEGELRGTNKTCHACAVRTDESDLIVMGEEATPSPQNADDHGQQKKMQEYLADSIQTWENGTLIDKPSQKSTPEQRIQNLVNEPVDMSDVSIPYIYSLDQLTLSPGFSRKRYASTDCITYRPPNSSSAIFWMGFIWQAFCILGMVVITMNAIEKSPTIYNIISSNLFALFFACTLRRTSRRWLTS